MATLEAIIGKEENVHRLLVTVGQKTFTIGNPQSVPNTVSRRHCSIRIEFSDNADRTVNRIEIRNLSPKNSTYVDHLEVESKSISEHSPVHLGCNRYPLDLHTLINYLKKLLPPPPPLILSIGHLGNIWKQYHDKQMALQKRQHTLGLWARVPILFSMSGGLLAAIVPDNLRPYMLVLTGISVLLTLYGFLQQKGFVLSEEMDKLNNWFQDHYVCPNCKHFMGNIPYKILRQNKNCPYCKCGFKDK